MSFYLDTSLLVAACTPETGSARSLSWLAEAANTPLIISDWVLTEFAGALSRKRRMNVITDGAESAAKAVFGQLLSSFDIRPVVRADFHLAQRYASNHESGIRPPDALHLAIASRHRALLCTLDKGLADGGTALGLAVHLL